MKSKNILAFVLVTCMLCSMLPATVFGTGISGRSVFKNAVLDPDTEEPAATQAPEGNDAVETVPATDAAEETEKTDEEAEAETEAPVLLGSGSGESVLEYNANGLHIILTTDAQIEDSHKLFGQLLTGEMLTQANSMLESALKNKNTQSLSGMTFYASLNNRPDMISVNGKVRWYTTAPDEEGVVLYEITMMSPAVYSFTASEIRYQQGEDTQGSYIEFPCSILGQGIYVFAKPSDKPPLPDITMKITEVNGEPIEPVSSWPVGRGNEVTLTAQTTAPDETFYLYIGGAVGNQRVTVTDENGTAVSSEQLSRQVADRGKPGPIYKITGVTPDTKLNIRINGTVYGGTYANVEGIFFVAEDSVETFGSISSTQISPISGGSICWLESPVLAFELVDQYDNAISPPESSDEEGTLMFLTGGSVQYWHNVVSDAVAHTTTEKMQAMETLADKIDAFVLLDENGREVGRCPVERSYSGRRFFSVCFDQLGIGTYTVDVIRKEGETLEFEPVSVEVKREPKKNISALYAIAMPFEGSPGLGLTEFVSSSEFCIYVNGEKIPQMSTQETSMIYTSLVNRVMYTPQTPLFYSACGAAVARMKIELPDAQQDETAVVMKIVQDGKKDAVTASYNDEIKWESTVNVGSSQPLDWIIELRYDVNNQKYPSGEGVNPLFDYDKDLNVSFILTDGTKVPLTEGENYTLDSPEGFFRVDQTQIDHQNVSIKPTDYNGTWPQAWYEISPQNGSKPYFLHPFFQKQVIRISPSETNLALLNGRSVKSIVVESSGKLSEYAYTGGYGNPARVLAFGKMIPTYTPPSPPIYKAPRLKTALPENPDSKEIPEYYLIKFDEAGYSYVNLGYDTTAVYTAAVTVHKVDENKEDLPGAEFVIEPQDPETQPKAIQGEATHLILSHFMPGFSSIRPVPDSADDVSRRNLTSIGEPALKNADPQGDTTSDQAYLTYAGLNEGNYVIRESKPPAGYKKAEDLTIDLSAELPERITTGYEFCRWSAKVNGKEIPAVEQLADNYPDIDDDAYQMFSCNSSQIVLRVIDEPNNVSVEKVWEDDDNAKGVRPRQIEIQLYCQDDASSEKTAYGSPVTLNEQNQWQYVFEKLDAEKIWSVEEVRIPENYEAEVTGDQSGGFTVTNYYQEDLTYGDLKITKRVPLYEDSGDVSFVFHVTAKMPGKDKVIFDDIVMITFSAAGSKTAVIAGRIPVGAEVTVTEIYSGAGYKVSGPDVRTAVIAAEKPVEVTFENNYDHELIRGYGILNNFTYNGTKWITDNEHDSADLSPVVPKPTER